MRKLKTHQRGRRTTERKSNSRNKGELTNVQTALAKTQKQQDGSEIQLAAVRRKINDQEAEIAELYDLQDVLEQYTRKNSLEIHGAPMSAYISTEEVVFKQQKL